MQPKKVAISIALNRSGRSNKSSEYAGVSGSG